MKYSQLTNSERAAISALRHKHLSCHQIAEYLGRHHSTIYREINRNKHPTDGAYRLEYACHRSSARRWKSRKKSQFSDDQWTYIKRFLAFEWTPEQISETLKKHDKMNISHETIYRFIRKDRNNGGDLFYCLRQSNKLRRKQHNSRDNRGILRGKRPIDQRHVEAQTRSASGHFEIDLMHGSKDNDCILTLVDRKTLFFIVRKLKNKSMKEVKKHLVRIIRK